MGGRGGEIRTNWGRIWLGFEMSRRRRRRLWFEIRVKMGKIRTVFSLGFPSPAWGVVVWWWWWWGPWNRREPGAAVMAVAWILCAPLSAVPTMCRVLRVFIVLLRHIVWIIGYCFAFAYVYKSNFKV